MSYTQARCYVFVGGRFYFAAFNDGAGLLSEGVSYGVY